MTAEYQVFKANLATIPKVGVVDPEDEDKLVSVGKMLSAHFLVALLEDYGYQVQFMDLSNIIDFGKPGERLSQEFYQNVARVVGEKIRLCGDKIPILTRFFGRLPSVVIAISVQH